MKSDKASYIANIKLLATELYANFIMSSRLIVICTGFHLCKTASFGEIGLFNLLMEDTAVKWSCEIDISSMSYETYFMFFLTNFKLL